MGKSLTALVNEISDCLEAADNESASGTQRSDGTALAERMQRVLPALLETTAGALTSLWQAYTRLPT